MTTRERPASRPRREPSAALITIIGEHLERQGMTRYALAQRLGLSRGYVYNLMSGMATPPSDDVIRQIAECLEGDPDTFLFAAGRLPQDLKAALLRLPPAMVRDFVARNRGWIDE